MDQLDPTLIKTLLIAVYGLVSFSLGYLICKYGLENLVKDVENLKIQSPIAVVPTPVVAATVTG